MKEKCNAEVISDFYIKMKALSVNKNLSPPFIVWLTFQKELCRKIRICKNKFAGHRFLFNTQLGLPINGELKT